MNKIIKQLSIVIVLTLIIQTVLPFISFANNSELEAIQHKYQITDVDLEKSLELISNNKELFLEFADEEVLKSYNLEDENAALLQYYLSTNSTKSNVFSTTIISNDEVIVQPT